MSRAIPSNFNEYLLDQTTRNTGIVCDGGIMPLRNNPDTSSLWYKNCIRGEDIMFLKEAIASRRNAASNDGLDDTSFKSQRLTTLQTQTGQLFDTGNWTDTDPRSVISFHSFGISQKNPTWQQVSDFVLSCFSQIQQASKYDTYVILDHVPVKNFFKDVKSLSYTWLNGNNIYYHYDGYRRRTDYTYRYYYLRNSTSGSPSITDEVRTDSYYMWQSFHQEQHSPSYPDGLQSLLEYSPISCTSTFTEDSWEIYRRRHRYLEVQPFGVFGVKNVYDAYDNTMDDRFESTCWVLAPYPSSVFFDILTATTLSMTDQTMWASWVANMYNAAGLAQNAADVGAGHTRPTGPYRSITQNSLINTPAWSFLIAHQKYCSLDGVNIS